MAQEIEKKFLVVGDFRQSVRKATRITQGYQSSVPERTVRVRVKGDKGYITIKGKGSESGASRFEWEKEIPVEEVMELLKICEPGVIDKTRYLVDVGDNEGLTVAEVELGSEDEAFERPQWLGQEVTGDMKYYNSMLIKNPYKNWK